MGFVPQSRDPEEEEVEYVGAPPEFADADEVPEWVENVAKALFFLPAAFVTATTIPLILGAMLLALCLCLTACGSLLGVY